MSRGGRMPPYRPQVGPAQTEVVFAPANAAGVRESTGLHKAQFKPCFVGHHVQAPLRFPDQFDIH